VLESQLSASLWITAEINSITAKPAGHCYLELADYDPLGQQLTAKAQAWIPASVFRMLRPYFETTAGTPLAPGLSVLVRASVQYHPLYGLTLQISDIDPVYTVGNIALERKKALERLRQEGVFDMNALLELPFPIQRIAVISSPQAAGFRDFTEQLSNHPWGYAFYVELFPSQMQGVEAPAGIISALEAIAQRFTQFDVVAIMRGGGSGSDLHCFDDYNLAYHVAQFPLPILTGIGHDQDEHLIDLVAHTAVKTPTALAQFLLDRMEALDQEVAAQGRRLQQLITGRLSVHKEALTSLEQRVKLLITGRLSAQKEALTTLEQRVKMLITGRLSAQKETLTSLEQRVKMLITGRLSAQKETLTSLEQRVKMLITGRLSAQKETLSPLAQRLKMLITMEVHKKAHAVDLLEQAIKNLNPLAPLQRGYALVLHQGKTLRDSATVTSGDRLNILLAQGSIEAEVV